MKILLTRPKSQSVVMQKELLVLGIEAVIEPLLEIKPLAWDIEVLNLADALIVTSANAVAALPAGLLARTLPVFAVGPETAEALGAAGFPDVRSARGTADDLMRLVRAEWTPQDGALLYLSGQEVSQEVAVQLCRHGYDARRIPVYAAEPASSLSPATASLLRRGQFFGVILMSVRTAATFRSLVAVSDLEEACGNMLVFCLSDKIYDAVRALRWAGVAVAATPTRTGMLQAIKGAGSLFDR